MKRQVYAKESILESDDILKTLQTSVERVVKVKYPMDKKIFKKYMEQAVIASSTAGGNLPQYLSYLESLVNASCQEIAFSNEE